MAIDYSSQVRNDTKLSKVQRNPLTYSYEYPETLNINTITLITSGAPTPENPTHKDRVYAFTPYTTGIYTFNTTPYLGNYYEVILDVYSDYSNGSLNNRVDSGAFFPVSPQKSMVLTGGVTYYLNFSPFYHFSGFSFNLEVNYSSTGLYLTTDETINTVVTLVQHNTYIFTPSSYGTYKFNAISSNNQASISILDSNLSEISSRGFGSNVSQNLNLIEGRTYYLKVMGSSYSNTNVSISLTKETAHFITAQLNTPINPGFDSYYSSVGTCG